jgi:hypothetical protein
MITFQVHLVIFMRHLRSIFSRFILVLVLEPSILSINEVNFFLSKGILVRHTSFIESELKTPSNVTSNWIYYY